MTPAGIEPATFRFVTQHLNHCATALPNRNEYQEYFLEDEDGRCLGLTTLLPSCTNCLKIWEHRPPGTLRLFTGLNRGCFKEWYLFRLGTAVAQWLRCCATYRKVAGSIPVVVSVFFIDIKSFRSHYGPGVDSASNRNEYQEYFLWVKAAGA